MAKRIFFVNRPLMNGYKVNVPVVSEQQTVLSSALRKQQFKKLVEKELRHVA